MSRGALGTRAAVAAALALVAGCGGSTVEGPPPAAPDRIRVQSPAFRDGGEIPVRYTCDGEKSPPPLRWSGVPARTRELALLVEDPDAPDGTFVHWTVWRLPPSLERLDGAAPAGAREGENSFGDDGWGAPCPPEDDGPHRYVFTLYALSGDLGLDDGAGPGEVRSAIGDKSIARGSLTGRFHR